MIDAAILCMCAFSPNPVSNAWCHQLFLDVEKKTLKQQVEDLIKRVNKDALIYGFCIVENKDGTIKIVVSLNQDIADETAATIMTKMKICNRSWNW